MRFWKRREKDGESAMWKYAKYAVVAVCVIGIGANSINVIPTGYTGVKSTFGKISEKELTTGIHISVPFVQHIQTISNKQHFFQFLLRQRLNLSSVSYVFRR